MIIGCALLALGLFALLYAWRTAIVALAAFVVSLTAAALVLTLTDSTFNALLFAGLAAAVIAVIDDGVIDVERTQRMLREAAPRGLAARATVVRDAASQTRSPMAYATLIAALVAVPIFFLEGLTGSFFGPVARAYVLALAVSMVVALVFTPALSLMLMARPRRGGGGPSPLARWTSGRYEGAVTRVVARPAIAFAAGGLAVLAGLALIPALHGPVIPSFKDRDLLVHLDGPPGTSRPREMSRIVQRAGRDLRAVPGVEDVGSHIGRAVTVDQVVDVNSSELWVKLDRDTDYAKTRAAVERVVDGYPGFSRSVVTYEKQRLRRGRPRRPPGRRQRQGGRRPRRADGGRPLGRSRSGRSARTITGSDAP